MLLPATATSCASASATARHRCLGLAYFGTEDGSDELDVASVAWWASPAAEWLSPLLTWAGPDRVYSTYVQLMALLFPAVLLCAVHARRHRIAVALQQAPHCDLRIELGGARA